MKRSPTQFHTGDLGQERFVNIRTITKGDSYGKRYGCYSVFRRAYGSDWLSIGSRRFKFGAYDKYQQWLNNKPWRSKKTAGNPDIRDLVDRVRDLYDRDDLFKEIYDWCYENQIL